MSATHIRLKADTTDKIYDTAPPPTDFLEHFTSKFSVNVIDDSDDELVVDLVGIDAPIANALRRILLAEVPTMAIENVFFIKYTSIMQEEVFAQRLGMVPLFIDPRLFSMREEGAAPTPEDTVVFSLDVEGTEGDLPSHHTSVMSGDLKWVPKGTPSAEMLANPPRPVHDDILLCKLKPGQRIHVECWAVKNIGREHAKWSPVSTATYRLLPEIQFTEPVTGDAAEQLVSSVCPVNVFDIEDLGGVRTAVTARPRDCTMCRNCIREAPLDSQIKLLRKLDHFICALPARQLFREALGILIEKAKAVSSSVTAAVEGGVGGGDGDLDLDGDEGHGAGAAAGVST